MAQTDLAVGAYLKVVHAEPATQTVGGYEALTWLEVDDVVNIGGGGGSAAVQSYTPLKSGITVKRSGAIEYQDRQFQMGRHVQADSTHALIKSGFDGAFKGDVFSWAIHYPDGSKDFFTATISTFTDEQLEANTFMFSSITLSPTVGVVTKAGVDLFTLTYTAGTNGTIVGTTPQIVESGDNGTAVYAAPDSGFAFSAWSDASTDNPRTDLAVGANITVTATFV